MNYVKQKNKIIINDITNFNIKHILECGQVFRFNKKELYYEVIAGKEIAHIFTHANKVVIKCSNENYFENYFDLKTDYKYIKDQLSNFEVLTLAIKFGYGIRILRQEYIETIISFIVSANNNIKRIKNSLNKLSEHFGTLIKNEMLGDYYAFPTLEQLSNISQEQFKELGVGYRAQYLVNAINQINSLDLNNINYLPVEDAVKKLMEISGVGPKVADCILLFAYYKMNVFPVDTWIAKVFNNYFEKTVKTSNRNIMRKNLTNIFRNLSGYAQQYLFYWEREQENSIK